MMAPRADDGLETLTHTREELLARYHKAMGGRPVAALEIDELSAHRLLARVTFEDGHTRPGGMVAGPMLFTLVDTIAYLVTISRSSKGSEALTTSVSMEFLRPAPVGVCLSREESFGSVEDLASWIRRSAAAGGLVAHAVVIYVPVFPGNAQM
jgi:acyl-coenzyme A thioesterase PaaI-like protein